MPALPLRRDSLQVRSVRHERRRLGLVERERGNPLAPAARAACGGRVILLRVTAPHFVAGAVFDRVGDGWMISRCAPILAWMRGKATDQIAGYLKRKKWAWEWL